MVAILPRTAWYLPKTWQGHAAFEPNLIQGFAWHYTGGNTNPASYNTVEKQAAFLRAMDADYLRRKPEGYNLGYSFVIFPDGNTWESRGLTDRGAANGSVDTNRRWVATLLVLPGIEDDVTAPMLQSARELVTSVRRTCPGAAKHVAHSDLYPTACCGDVLRARVRNGDFEPPVVAPPVNRPATGVPEGEDPLAAFSEEQLRAIISQEVLGVTTMVMRSEEFKLIVSDIAYNKAVEAIHAVAAEAVA